MAIDISALQLLNGSPIEMLAINWFAFVSAVRDSMLLELFVVAVVEQLSNWR